MAGYGRRYKRLGEEERLLGDRNNEAEDLGSRKSRRDSRSYQWTLMCIVALMGTAILGIVYLVVGYGPLHAAFSVSQTQTAPDGPAMLSSPPRPDKFRRPRACNTVNGGYNCFSDISHRWGQYSPYFSLAGEGASDDVPNGCHLTFVQVLSRHGARYPTESKSLKYAELMADIQANATAFKGETAFLRDYNYTLGSDDLTTFGERQMFSSGVKFYERYSALTQNIVPFIRASGSSRVVASANQFIQGFQESKTADRCVVGHQPTPKINVIISEQTGSNNSLNHNTCPKLETDPLSDNITDHYAAIIAPPIAQRLQSLLPGVTLSAHDVTYLMDMCAFDTVALTPDGSIQSPFCTLFTSHEWTQYNYLQSLWKYYGFGAGNPLGPTQGVGFVNELIARLTHSPVHDHTSTNSTLDAPGASTFPLNSTLYADFTHDNGLIPIYFALGLYNGTHPLPKNHIQSPDNADGYSAAWTVPFAARAYVEMMQCEHESEPFVRVLVNDRVVPLHGCMVDALGRCRRDDFIKALSFARDGGDWMDCYS